MKFSFGRNWKNYVLHSLTEQKLEEAKQSLLSYLPAEEFKDKTFIDIGSGSGIFSLSAARLGCRKVISFDVDPYSVETTNIVKNKFKDLIPNGTDWEIHHASILEENRPKVLGDIVYSWGVLHHTGNMWPAIKNAASMVLPGGWFIIAIYNKAPSSNFWLKLKKFYNRTNVIFQGLMISLLYAYVIAGRIASAIIDFFKGRKHKSIFFQDRGMSVYYDVVDWIGGYPYEFATWQELKDFIEPLGFELKKTPTLIPEIPNTFRNRYSLRSTGNHIVIFRKGT
jgi:SAM-dependent methyltransferase